ncbi:unnamed protein product [Brassicogethes aeneus]|uniref:non-specific serine/threonine protein kinase n=1 Tax=Brassicogethes aeneus TaxID=1431903 RepID=A0A9P0FPT1_BRAAE|nr:unnamed protein product [Brassicogethes aeneus]
MINETVPDLLKDCSEGSLKRLANIIQSKEHSNIFIYDKDPNLSYENYEDIINKYKAFTTWLLGQLLYVISCEKVSKIHDLIVKTQLTILDSLSKTHLNVYSELASEYAKTLELLVNICISDVNNNKLEVFIPKVHDDLSKKLNLSPSFIKVNQNASVVIIEKLYGCTQKLDQNVYLKYLLNVFFATNSNNLDIIFTMITHPLLKPLVYKNDNNLPDNFIGVADINEFKKGIRAFYVFLGKEDVDKTLALTYLGDFLTILSSSMVGNLNDSQVEHIQRNYAVILKNMVQNNDPNIALDNTVLSDDIKKETLEIIFSVILKFSKKSLQFSDLDLQETLLDTIDEISNIKTHYVQIESLKILLYFIIVPTSRLSLIAINKCFKIAEKRGETTKTIFSQNKREFCEVVAHLCCVNQALINSSLSSSLGKCSVMFGFCGPKDFVSQSLGYMLPFVVAKVVEFPKVARLIEEYAEMVDMDVAELLASKYGNIFLHVFLNDRDHFEEISSYLERTTGSTGPALRKRNFRLLMNFHEKRERVLLALRLLSMEDNENTSKNIPDYLQSLFLGVLQYFDVKLLSKKDNVLLSLAELFKFMGSKHITPLKFKIIAMLQSGKYSSSPKLNCEVWDAFISSCDIESLGPQLATIFVSILPLVESCPKKVNEIFKYLIVDNEVYTRDYIPDLFFVNNANVDKPILSQIKKHLKCLEQLNLKEKIKRFLKYLKHETNEVRIQALKHLKVLMEQNREELDQMILGYNGIDQVIVDLIDILMLACREKDSSLKLAWTYSLILSLPNEIKTLLLACSPSMKQDHRILIHFLPYILLHSLLEGSNDIQEKCVVEFQAVTNAFKIKKELNHRILNARPLPIPGMEVIPQVITPEEVKQLECTKVVFLLLDFLDRWLREWMWLKGQSGNSNENYQALKNFQNRFCNLHLAKCNYHCAEYPRALMYLEDYITKNPKEKDNHLSFLAEIYAQLDEPDGVAGVTALQQKEPSPEFGNMLLEMQAEPLWRLGRYDDLDKFLNKDDMVNNNSWGVNIGKRDLFNQVIDEIKIQQVESLGASSMEMGVYQRGYSYISRLHAINELEQVEKCINELLLKPNDKNYAEAIMKKLSMEWELRIKVVQESIRIIEPVLCLRRAALNMGKSIIEEKAPIHQQAYTYTIKAEEYAPQRLFLEKAKLHWLREEHEQALTTLKRGLELVMPETGSTQAMAALSLEQKKICAEAMLLTASYNDSISNVDTEINVQYYKESFETYKEWEKSLVCLAQYYDRIFQTHSDEERDTKCASIQLHMINYFLKSLQFGTEFIYQSLPRILSIWFDFGTRLLDVTSNTVKEERKNMLFKMTKLIDDSLKRLPAYIFLTAFSQIISRICHPQKEHYPQQCLWMIISVVKSSYAIRSKRCMEILNDSNLKTGSMLKLVKDFTSLAEKLIELCNKEIPADVSSTKVSQLLRALPR